jgi:hypothetical protein
MYANFVELLPPDSFVIRKVGQAHFDFIANIDWDIGSSPQGLGVLLRCKNQSQTLNFNQNSSN